MDSTGCHGRRWLVLCRRGKRAILILRLFLIELFDDPLDLWWGVRWFHLRFAHFLSIFHNTERFKIDSPVEYFTVLAQTLLFQLLPLTFHYSEKNTSHKFALFMNAFINFLHLNKSLDNHKQVVRKDFSPFHETRNLITQAAIKMENQEEKKQKLLKTFTQLPTSMFIVWFFAINWKWISDENSGFSTFISFSFSSPPRAITA